VKESEEGVQNCPYDINRNNSLESKEHLNIKAFVSVRLREKSLKIFIFMAILGLRS